MELFMSKNIPKYTKYNVIVLLELSDFKEVSMKKKLHLHTYHIHFICKKFHKSVNCQLKSFNLNLIPLNNVFKNCD